MPLRAATPSRDRATGSAHAVRPQSELEEEWRRLMARVPKEEADEVAGDFDLASADEKKRMVWDVRKFLAVLLVEAHHVELRTQM